MVQFKIRFKQLEDIKHFVNTASKCNFSIDIKKGSITLDGKSLEGLCSLELNSDLECIVHDTKEAAKQFMDNIQDYII